MSKENYYSDINLSWRLHPLTGDFLFVTDVEAVKRSLKHLSLMRKYDKPFIPEMHGHVEELLFELPSMATESTLASRLKWVYQRYEPRARIIDITVTTDSTEAGYDITVKFEAIGIVGEQSMSFTLERIR